MAMALEGVKVVELAAFEAGPVAATVLGDYGAEVVKVERPEVGDPMRDQDTLYGRLPQSDIHSILENFHRNKKSICINLKSKEGQQAIHRLIQMADVFISNVELVELDKFRMDYETLSKMNPRLIYAHSTAYGHAGPDARKRGFDMGAWARSGTMLRMAEPGGVPPQDALGLTDGTTATFTALGIILALYEREHTGKGQMVTNSLFGSILWGNIVSVGTAAISGKEELSHTRADEPSPFSNRYLTKDGRWLILLRSDWHETCEVMGMQEYEKDPRFDSYKKRVDNSSELIALLDKAIVTRTAREWAEAFEGKDIIWSMAQTYLEAAHDPQSEANHYVVDFDHPKHGPIKLVGFPVRLSRTPPTTRTPAPELGEHTDEVLQALGYGTEEIATLKDSGAVWPK